MHSYPDEMMTTSKKLKNIADFLIWVAVSIAGYVILLSERQLKSRIPTVDGWTTQSYFLKFL